MPTDSGIHPVGDEHISEKAYHSKQKANSLFGAKDFEGAVECYRTALSEIQPSPSNKMKSNNVGSSYENVSNSHNCSLVWPQQEEFALILHSNLAMCYIKLQRPDSAVFHASEAKRLPIFSGGKAKEKLRQKILSRYIEALLMIMDNNNKKDEAAISERAVSVNGEENVSAATKDEIWLILYEACQRGYLTNKTICSLETQLTFLRYGGKLAELLQHHKKLQYAEEGKNNSTIQMVNAWTNQLVEFGVCSLEQATKAQQKYNQKTNNSAASEETALTPKQLDLLALNVIQELLPSPAFKIGEVCRKIVFAVEDGDTKTAVTTLRHALQKDQGCYAAQVDDDKTGYLLWAVCFGILNAKDRGERPTATFCEVLSLLIGNYQVCIDQRGSDGESRNPLQYVAKAGRPKAVRAMIELGANVNLRDREGWTALHAVCMNDVTEYGGGGPSIEDRVKTAKIILEAGADIEAETYNGMTPLIALLATKIPCLELLELLLSSGANGRHRSKNGWTATFLVESFNGATRESCTELLQRYDSFAEEDTKMVKFTKFLDNVILPMNNSFAERNPLRMGSPQDRASERVEQEQANLRETLKYIRMDPGLLTRKILSGSKNWLAEFHERVNAMVPKAFQKVYFLQNPSREELGLIMANNGYAFEELKNNEGSGFDEETVMNTVLKPYRNRGRMYLTGHMYNYFYCIINSVQHCVGFAVPSESVLERIADYGPVVEVGAGTGYWTAILRSRGVDVLAYDATPPKPGLVRAFFDTMFTQVEKGDATNPSFWEKDCGDSPNLAKRTLLIVWPNNPDETDNPHLYDSFEDHPPVWDADCLSEYMKAGGEKVIFVGEREENIQVLSGSPPDCGVSASRRFQNMLKKYFNMVECHKIPTWLLSQDDATFWELKN